MTHATSQRPSRYPLILMSGSIRLGQLLKLTGLVEDGAQTRIAIQSGSVTVNGVVETYHGHRLAGEDAVVADHPAGQADIAVEQLGPGQ